MRPKIESEFLNAITADPANAELRLVYADWLEEHGDDAGRVKAEYLRLCHAFESMPADDPGRPELGIRLANVREELPFAWWRRFDRGRVEKCGRRMLDFEFQCPKQWDTLTPTKHVNVRHCSECEQNVYYCRTTKEAQRRSRQNQCVALDSRLLRSPLDPGICQDSYFLDNVVMGVFFSGGEASGAESSRK